MCIVRQKGLTSSDKRILTTNICGDAYAEVMAEMDVEKIGERTGCLMTIDGSLDDKISPQGIKDYKFLPEHADLPCFNVKGDNNDVAEVNEAGLVGELEEVDMEDGEGEEENEDVSSDEDEDILLVSEIHKCEWQKGTIKYLCSWRGYDAEDTTFEPRDMTGADNAQQLIQV